MKAQHIATWSAAYSVCLIVTQIFAGYPADWFGRRGTMAILVTLMGGANIVEMLARDWKVWIIARALAGLSLGL
jgi:MFS family permease